MLDIHELAERETLGFPPAPIVGRAIAEFDCGKDALDYAKAKGPGYTVTAGITHLFAVRELVGATP